MRYVKKNGEQVDIPSMRGNDNRLAKDEEARRKARDVAFIILVRLGWTSREIAKLFGVCSRTVRNGVNDTLIRSRQPPVVWPLRRSGMGLDQKKSDRLHLIKKMLLFKFTISDIAAVFRLKKNTIYAILNRTPDTGSDS